MAQVKMTRTSMVQTLAAAFEGILDLFEKTIEDYEEQLRQSKEENRKHSLLGAAFSPVVRLHRLDVHQLMKKREEMLSSQQMRSTDLIQEAPAEPADIKEEQKEEWSSQEREQLQERSDAEETPQIFQINEIKSEEYSNIENLKTEADAEDCGGSKPELEESVTQENTSCASSEDNNSLCDWEQTFKSLSDFNPLQNTVEPLKDIECDYGNAPPSLSEHGIGCKQNVRPQETTAEQNTARPISCPFCAEVFYKGVDLKEHLKVHRKKKFGCSFCLRRFKLKKKLDAHMRTHREDALLSSDDSPSTQQVLDSGVTNQSQASQYPCEVCSMSFPCKDDLDAHSKIHNKEKCTCTVCGKSFARPSTLTIHMRLHTGEKPFCCSVCGRSFRVKVDLANHMSIHTGEKPYGCAFCSRGFCAKVDLADHMRMHTGEKPYSCTVCGQTFRTRWILSKHKRTMCSNKEEQMHCA